MSESSDQAVTVILIQWINICTQTATWGGRGGWAAAARGRTSAPRGRGSTWACAAAAPLGRREAEKGHRGTNARHSLVLWLKVSKHIRLYCILISITTWFKRLTLYYFVGFGHYCLSIGSLFACQKIKTASLLLFINHNTCPRQRMSHNIKNHQPSFMMLCVIKHLSYPTVDEDWFKKSQGQARNLKNSPL